MIKYFSVENYKSIKNKAILEFDSNLGEDYPYPASAVIGFAGANASGKTTILQAISFVFWFMQKSFTEIKQDQAIPCQPFVSASDFPIHFHLIFTQKDSDDKYIDYEYLLTVNQQKVLKEEIFYYPDHSQEQELIYEREQQKVTFGSNIHTLDNDVISALPDKSSVISFLSQFPSQKVAGELQKYQILSNINPQGIQEFEFNSLVVKSLMKFSNEQSENLIKTLILADIGIRNISFEKEVEDIEKEVIDILSLIATQDNEAIPTRNSVFINPYPSKLENKLEIEKKLENLLLRKSFKPTSKIKFHHKMDDSIVNLDYLDESAGTLKFLALWVEIQMAFKEGYLLIIDEIELQLHQNLTAYLIGLFENLNQNMNGGQLLFSFHNTALMEILQPNQLWFTEKNDQGQTEIFSAADFTDIQEIEKRNLEELYRIGRFGAKPRAL